MKVINENSRYKSYDHLRQSSGYKSVHVKPKGIGFGIRARLFIGFTLITVIFALAISIAFLKINKTEVMAKQIVNNSMPSFDSEYDLLVQLNTSRAAVNGYMLTKIPQYKADYDNANMHITTLINMLDKLSDAWVNKDDIKIWGDIKFKFAQLRTEEENILHTTDAAQITEMQKNKLIPITNGLLDLLDGPINADGERNGGLFDKQLDQVGHGTLQIMQDLNEISLIQVVLLVITVIMSITIAIVTSNKILQPLKSAISVAKSIASGERNIHIEAKTNDETRELLIALDTMQSAIRENEKSIQESEKKTRQLFDNVVTTAKKFSRHSGKVAAGDLTQRLEVDNDDVMARLGNDLNTMTEGLLTITKKITQASHDMVTTIEEVKHAIDMQSTGSSEQASSINEITASLEEIEKSSIQTIEKAKSLGDAAEKTREKGQLGLEAVEQSIVGMKTVRDKVQTIAQTILELSHQTQQVGEITAVVNSLAQQSKMLALNASIEAAKAGEAGKGFAVVAAEVKNLAEQSEQSTTQVQKILEDIRHATEKAVMATEEGTKGVDHGTGLVEQTGEIVRNLSDVIHETTIASQQIEASIRQEGVGIEQITAGMNEINQVTAAFVESVKQTTEAIGHIDKIAKNLQEYIEIYKI